MTGFEPGSSCIVSDRSANCATTTSLEQFLDWFQQKARPGVWHATKKC